MHLTPARQRNAVSEGAALGLLLCGRAELPFEKTKLDLAFGAAWRDWEYRGRFSQVQTDLAKGLDGYIALTRADESKQVVGLYWRRDGKRLIICTRNPDWNVENPDDVEFALDVIDGEVPREGWVGLARDFLSKFGC